MLLHAAAALSGLAFLAVLGTGATSSDAAAVRGVVQSAYVEGVHAHPDSAAMRSGFHPDFRMLVLRNGTMTAVTLEEWIARMEQSRAEKPAPLPTIEANFTNVDVTGDAATVRLELKRDGKHVFTDYLSLYRFADGWKIVSKTFQAHS